MADKRSVLVIGAGDATGGAIARRFAREGLVAVVTRQAVHAEATREGVIAEAAVQIIIAAVAGGITGGLMAAAHRVGVDLIVFAVKLGDTEAAARQLAPMIGPETRILTLQNGIDSVDLIRAQYPQAVVLGGAGMKAA